MGMLGVLGLMTGLSFAHADEGTIGQLTIGGTCKQGDTEAQYRFVPDAEGLTLQLTFENFKAELLSQQAIARENCQVALPLAVPPGKRIIIEDATSELKARVHEGVTATATLSTWLASRPPTEPTPMAEWEGPSFGVREIRDDEPAIGRCGKADIVRASIAVVLRKTDRFSLRPRHSAVDIRTFSIRMSFVDCKPTR